MTRTAIRFSSSQLAIRELFDLGKTSVHSETLSRRQTVKSYLLERSLISGEHDYLQSVVELSSQIGEELNPQGFVSPYTSIASDETVEIPVRQDTILANFKAGTSVDRFTLARLSGIVWHSETDLAIPSSRYRVVDEQLAKLTFPQIFLAHSVSLIEDMKNQVDALKVKLAHLQSSTSDLNSDDIALSFMYLNDSIEQLVFESKSNLLPIPVQDTPVRKVREEKVKKQEKVKLLVVGLWPRQYESLRLSFDKSVWDLLDITYVASDKHRKNRLSNADNFDLVLCNASAINHAIGDDLISNLSSKTRYQLYEGGVSSLKSIIINKASSGVFGPAFKQIFCG